MINLQFYRKKNNLTQEEVAKYLNCSQQTYANYESENSQIPLKTLKKLSSLLKFNIADLFNNDQCNNISDFLHKSYTAYHAVDNCKIILNKSGFKELKENQKWELNANGKYYVTKNNTAIIAFVIGDLKHFCFNITSCHTDSPCLKIKGNSLINSIQGKRINVERYGGLINYSFMDIPLRIAGRIIVNDKGLLKEKLYSSNFNVNIPSLCIHHNPSVNEGAQLTIQNDMLPLVGDCLDLYKRLSPNEEIIEADLYCVPDVLPTYTGVNNEFLTSPRIDNLTSFYSIINSLTNENLNRKGVSLLYAVDNEEVGSLSKQGAESAFLPNVLKRINSCLNKTEEEFDIALSNSFVMSIDNAHATHPAHPEKNDPDYKVLLNGGVVIKHHPNYSTDALSSAYVKMLAKSKCISIQDYYNNSNIRCGSTIGLITSSQLAINTIDIGLPQLAMHSAIETIGVNDILSLTKLVDVFFESIFVTKQE